MNSCAAKIVGHTVNERLNDKDKMVTYRADYINFTGTCAAYSLCGRKCNVLGCFIGTQGQNLL